MGCAESKQARADAAYDRAHPELEGDYSYRGAESKRATYALEFSTTLSPEAAADKTGKIAQKQLDAIPQVLFVKVTTADGNVLPLQRITNVQSYAGVNYRNFRPAKTDLLGAEKPPTGGDKDRVKELISVDRFIIQAEDLDPASLQTIEVLAFDPDAGDGALDAANKDLSFKDWHLQKLVVHNWRRPDAACVFNVGDSFTAAPRPDADKPWALQLTNPAPLTLLLAGEPGTQFDAKPPPEGTACGPLVGLVRASGTSWTVSVVLIVEADVWGEKASDAKLTVTCGTDGPKSIPYCSKVEEYGRTRLTFVADVPLGGQDASWSYTLPDPDGRTFALSMPAEGKAPVIGYHSCSGHWNAQNLPGLARIENGAENNALWARMIAGWDAATPHLLLGGGDQVYADPIWGLAPIQEWVRQSRDADEGSESVVAKVEVEFDAAMRAAVECFYLDLYCKTYNGPYVAQARATIPSYSMWDDHDIVDGWGSFDAIFQAAPVMQGIFCSARRYFLDLVCGLPDVAAARGQWTEAHKVMSAWPKPEAFLSYPRHGRDYGTKTQRDNFTSVIRFGGDLVLVNLDLRSERTKSGVMSEEVYTALYERLAKLPEGTQHILVQSSMPLMWPNGIYNFVRGFLAKQLRRIGVEVSSELATTEAHTVVREDGIKERGALQTDDDVRDSWHAGHPKERNALLGNLVKTASQLKARVTIIAGDFHDGARSISYDKDNTDDNYHVINHFVSSGICAIPTNPSGLTYKLVNWSDNDWTVKAGDIDKYRLQFLPFSKRTDGGPPRDSDDGKPMVCQRNFGVVTADEPDGSLNLTLVAEPIYKGDEPDAFDVYNMRVNPPGSLDDKSKEELV